MRKALCALFPHRLFRLSYIKDVYSIHYLGTQNIVTDTIFHLNEQLEKEKVT